MQSLAERGQNGSGRPTAAIANHRYRALPRLGYGAVGCGMISATFQFGPAPFGCSRLIVTSWISLPPRVRLAIFKHSASSQALLLVRFCCSFLFCLMDEGLGNLGV